MFHSRSLLACLAVTLAGAPLALPGAAQTSADRGWPFTGLGTTISMADGEVFVGRPAEFALFPMPAARTGGVAIFAREGDTWREIAALEAEDGAIGDAFGSVLAVDGNRLAVGAPKAREGRGAVYVFERERRGAAWRQTARLDADAAARSLGASVAIQGDWIIAGAPGTAVGGAAYAFRAAGGGWREAGQIVPTGLAVGEAFGTSVSLSGDRVLVGAPGPLPIALLGAPQPPQPGAAYLFRNDGAAWTEAAKLVADSSISLGFSVSLNGGEAVASAPFQGNGAGAVYTFADSAGTWIHTGVVRTAAGAPGTLFGYAMAVSAEALFVGQPFAQGGQGGVIVFDRADDEWVERQTLTKSLVGFQPFYGGAMAVEGRRAVLGAPGADFFEGMGVVVERSSADADWREVSTFVDATPGLTPITGGQVDCTEGAASEWSCEDVDIVSFLPVDALGGERGVLVNDVWGWTDSLTGREYAIVGRTDATTFIDIGDPANPVYLGYLPLTSTARINIWRDVKVYKNHAYIVADGAGEHGVQIFDLTQLRSVANPPVEFTETAHYSGIFSAHNIVINENTGFAYSVGSSSGGETCGGGLHMIDIRDPANPTFAGCFSDSETGNAGTGYSHDAQCIVYHGPDEDYTDREICFGSNETALSIADVTDKESPVAVSRGAYPSVVYAHQGWVSDDQRYFFMNDEGDELTGATPRTRTLVWDIEDLDDPILLTEFMGTTQASDHNLYVRGDYMYQSNYVSGLRIIDVSDPARPTEVGYFDTVRTGEDVPGFMGSWSNFPFFDSGVIVVSSMREGVFFLKKRDVRPIP